MRIRFFHVSNSSSSSFIILRRYVSADQLEKIENHREKADRNAWNIEVDEDIISCDTSMDNFDLVEYVEELGVPSKAIKGLYKD